MKPLPVSDDLWLCENAVYLPQVKTLVISDLQLGYEQQLRDAGSNILYEQAEQMLSLLQTLLAQTGATRIVIDGDLKHEFGRISYSERRDIVGILSRLKAEAEIIVVRGNHDTVTRPLTDSLDIALTDFWADGGFYVIHGHELPDPDNPAYVAAHTVIIGHMHPAITLHDGVRGERYKCFLIGTYKKKRLVVLPSFSTIVEGSDILKVHGSRYRGSRHRDSRESRMASNSPLLQGHNSSRVFVLADDIRSFGKVSDLRRILG